MATTLQQIITSTRLKFLRETTASYWTDAELLEHVITGIDDLWKAVIDLHQEHFITVDDTNVSLVASTALVSGIPTDCFRIVSIEARDLSESSVNLGLEFFPRDWNHPEMVNARRQPAITPRDDAIYYTVFGQGPPIGAISIRVAPQVNSDVNLTLAYIPVHGAAALSDNNPIPGKSDLALQAWTAAHARAKEREDGSPDPDMLAIYANEKQNILVVLTPRQEQELETVEGMFEGLY